MAFPDDIVKGVDFVTSLPGKVSRKSDEINDKMIRFGRQLQNAKNSSIDVATQNLKQNKIESLGRDTARWLSDPKNLAIAGAGLGILIAIIIYISRRF